MLCIGVRALTTRRRVTTCACPSEIAPSDRAWRIRPSMSPAPTASPFAARIYNFSKTSRAIAHGLAGPVRITTLPCACASMSKSVFKEREVAVEFTEQLCQQTIVFEGYDDTSGFKYRLARPSRRWRGCPAKCSQIPTLLFWPYPKIESPLAPTLASKRLLGTFAVCLTHNFTCAHYNRFMLQR